MEEIETLFCNIQFFLNDSTQMYVTERLNLYP